MIISDVPVGYGNYSSIQDLINKRDTFIQRLKACQIDLTTTTHYTGIAEQILYNRNLIQAASSSPTAAEVPVAISNLCKLYDRYLQPAVSILDSEAVPKYSCFGQLDLADIYHDGHGSVFFDNIANTSNDYIWDYAGLLARNYTDLTYVAILNNNKLTAELVERYNDCNASIRLIIEMVLIDILDTLTGYLDSNNNQSSPRSTAIASQRATRFLEQSYTTINYFLLVYERRSK